MSVSAPFLGLGLALTGLGTTLLLLSFNKRNDDRKEHHYTGVIFLGPIPIASGGRNSWTSVGIAVVVIIFLFVAAAMAQPEILGL
jgi:uncharacterized membrane protein